MAKGLAQIDYGNNKEAGKYVESSGAGVYYEIYGEGPPLVLLHGSLYSYINDYGKYIPQLTKYFKVIAIGTRGHGRSFLGHEPFSYDLLSGDVKKVLDQEKINSASFLGFSTGANAARYFNVHHPTYVTKLVSMAGGMEYSDEAANHLKNMNFASFEKDNKKLVDLRKSQMPEPNRYPEVLENLKLLWQDENFLKKDAFTPVRNPVLIIVGDRDDFYSVEQTVEVYRNTPTGRLCVVPDRSHVGLLFDESVWKNIIIPFLLEK